MPLVLSGRSLLLSLSTKTFYDIAFISYILKLIEFFKINNNLSRCDTENFLSYKSTNIKY
ncbi:MAG: hypothetical protein CMK44_03205 [Porticoccus sp.]|nr:hypothetical protein [Porticoccus sp.]